MVPLRVIEPPAPPFDPMEALEHVVLVSNSYVADPEPGLAAATNPEQLSAGNNCPDPTMLSARAPQLIGPPGGRATLMAMT
jgi:hypothetical protein